MNHCQESIGYHLTTSSPLGPQLKVLSELLCMLFFFSLDSFYKYGFHLDLVGYSFNNVLFHLPQISFLFISLPKRIIDTFIFFVLPRTCCSLCLLAFLSFFLSPRVFNQVKVIKWRSPSKNVQY